MNRHATPRITPNCFTLLVILVACFLTVPCPAQGPFIRFGEGVWTYEASTDRGQTWQGGIVSASSGAIVRVRSFAGFERITSSSYFGSVAYDGQIEHAGAGDAVQNLAFPQLAYNGFVSLINTQRFNGTTLKIDFAADTEHREWGRAGSRRASPTRYWRPFPSSTIRFS